MLQITSGVVRPQLPSCLQLLQGQLSGIHTSHFSGLVLLDLYWDGEGGLGYDMRRILPLTSPDIHWQGGGGVQYVLPYNLTGKVMNCMKCHGIMTLKFIQPW